MSRFEPCAVLIACAAGGALVSYLWMAYQSKPMYKRVRQGVVGLIGNTPLVEIKSLSAATGCRILGKCEFVNPGGSVKDRVALQLIQEAEENGLLKPGDTIYEGTAGSTGISLAMLARAKGYRCCIYMPDDQAQEKVDALLKFSADVIRVRPVSIVNENHFVNLARKQAQTHEERMKDGTRGYFCDQFENLANFRAHYLHTGPEIARDASFSGVSIDAFVCAAGTGGTMAGISCSLVEITDCQVFLIDPPGSSLYNKVMNDVMYTNEEAEGKRLANPFDTITEGIGINRLTANFKEAEIDHAFKGTDQEAVDMANYLLRHEGMYVGSSSAMNCVGAVKASRKLGPGHTIVTVLCDGGARHASKLYNDTFLAENGLAVRCGQADDLSFAL
eukprot:CFRG8508T1